MTTVLYRASGPVTMVGSGPVSGRQLARALEVAPEAVAADGGGDVPLPGDARFRAVIGDMDSLRDPERLKAAGVPLHGIAEQDTTDLEKCLYSVDAPLFIGLGFLGGQIDHQLAALNALAKYPGKRVVLIGGRDLCFLCPPELALALPADTRISLFPMAAVRGRVSQGLRWPVDGLAFAPDGRIGTSNRALGGQVRIGFDPPSMLVLLPAGRLRAVAAAFAAGG